MSLTGAAFRLIRLDTSLAGFLLLFLPVAVRAKDARIGLLVAAPVFFISICTFIANDLNDRERDEINHPDRPLPSGHIAPSFAATLYFASLAAALLTTRYWVEGDIAAWYYTLVALSISYGHIVEFLPALKAAYVAAVIALPVVIVASTFGDPKLYGVASAAFLFNLGKELCMDVLDRPGDRPSLVHQVAPTHIFAFAMLLQLISFVLLLALSRFSDQWLTAIFLTIAAACQCTSVYHLITQNVRAAVQVMRLELAVCFYFLVAPI